MAENDILIAKQGGWRIFVQEAGSSPANPYNYYGALSLSGLPQEFGAGTPVYVPSSTVRNKWDIIDNIPAAESLVTTDFTQRMDKLLRDFWWDQRRNNCMLNAVIVYDDCGKPDDINDFVSKIVLHKLRLTNFDPGAFNPLSGDENALNDLTGSLEIQSIDPFRPIKWAEKADAALLAEVLDIVIGDSPSCGDCGTPSDGCQYVYALQIANSGSPGLSAQVLYSANGFNTTSAMDVTTLAGASANDIAVVGRYIVVVSNADNSHHYALKSDVDAGIVSWAEVTSGYVASSEPNAMYVKSPAKVFIAADAGYIYLMSNPTNAVTVISDGSATTQNLTAIDGFGSTIVAVGASNAVLVSNNGGNSFGAITGPSGGNALTTIDVVSEKLWWVGTDNGELWYTINGGDSWVQKVVASDISRVDRVVFVDEIVGYVSVRPNSGNARVYRTSDNGFSWHNTSPYIESLPAATNINALTPCGYNKLFGGGVQSGGDGLLALAS